MTAGFKQWETDKAALEAEAHRCRESVALAEAKLTERRAALADAEHRLAKHVAAEPVAV